MNNLGFYLLISLLLNVVCFAPLMTFLLTRPSRNAPPPVHTVQVRLLRPDQPENLKVPTPPPPPKPQRQPPPVATAPPPPRPLPQPRPQQPRPVEAPEVPRARPRTAARKPSAPLPPSPSRPRESTSFTVPSRPTTPPASFNPNAASTPSPGEPGPAEPAPLPPPPAEPQPPVGEPTGPSAPASTPVPPPAEPPPQSPPPPPDPGPLSSRGNNTQGTIPDKAASPRGSFPNSNIRTVLRKLGSKTFVRLGLRIHPDGHIDVEILTGSGIPELDQAVLKDLRDWRWDPAEVAGKPVVSERPIRIKLEAD